MDKRTIILLNGIALVTILTINALANILPINGMNTGEISALYPSLFTPAGFTFSVWSVIYLLLIGFVLAQSTISTSLNFYELSLWFWLSCLANGGWILAWHYHYLVASVVIMITLLFSLVRIFLLMQSMPLPTPVQKLFVKLPFTFYLSWICVATIANVSALLVSWSWEGGPLSAASWTITMMSVATLLAIYIVARFREPAFLLVLIWALFGIYSKWKGTENNNIAWAAFAELILLALLFIFFVIRKKSSVNDVKPGIGY